MHAFPGFKRTFSRIAVAAAALVALAGGPAEANPKYAGYVYDVNADKVLYSEQATEKRYPASLTKIMTCYLIFEELAAGRMTFGTQMSVSTYAAGRPPSKIGFQPGGTIEVRDAIKALVTKSANDVAVVVAEHISGSEAAFAKRMTETAKRLGMNSTVFRNANGLPNDAQFTTAQDMATLGLAIQRDFPQYYGVFQTRVFQYGTRRYGNHNKLLGRVEGVDGIKTGYIRASGFNLVSSVRRDGRHIVAVVMGGHTGASRDSHMKELIGRYLPKAKKGQPLPLLAYNDAVPPPLPNSKPTLAAVYVARFNAKADESTGGDRIEEQILAFAADMRRPAASSLIAPAGDPNTLTAVIAQASEAGIAAPSAEPLPATSVTVAAVEAAPRQARTSAAPDPVANSVVITKTVARTTDASGDRFTTAFTTIEVNRGSGDGMAGLLAAIDRAAARQKMATPSAPQAARPNMVEARAIPAGAMQAANRWQIQVGAVGSPGEAEALLADAAQTVPSLAAHEKMTLPVTTSRGTLYRARFAGFASQSDARDACKRFANHNRPCWAVSM